MLFKMGNRLLGARHTLPADREEKKRRPVLYNKEQAKERWATIRNIRLSSRHKCHGASRSVNPKGEKKKRMRRNTTKTKLKSLQDPKAPK